MLPRKFKIKYAACSLFFILTGCNDGPVVDVCISNPDKMGFECVAKDQKTTYFLEYKNSRGIIGIPGDDFKTLIEWIKRNKR